MSVKKETTIENSTIEQPNGSVNTEIPQSVYIKNSNQSNGRVIKKSED